MGRHITSNYSKILKFIILINFSIIATVVDGNSRVRSKREIVGSDSDVLFKKQIEDLKQLKRLDIVFLIDGSSSVGLRNFESELNFVKKLLSDFTLSENRTKVSVVVFGSNAIVYEHSDKCELLNSVLPSINYPGSNTNTLGAFLATREILHSSRKNAYKAVFLVTDGFSNGGNPIPVAEDLKKDFNITIFTLGIVNGNRRELELISSHPNTSYFLESFDKFDLLARKALHTDLKEGDYIRLEEEKCGGCDSEAICTCGTTSGHYSCKCRPGYFGTGKKNDCTPCPKGTWHDKFSGICMPCPDFNHYTNESNPATSIEECRCKVGYKKPTRDPYKCEVMRCPKLKPPENGYFVGKTNCPNVLNSACGVRCNVGYSLRGTSIRICRENGQWDGLEPQCHLKTCPRPPIPVGGEVFCNNTDLDLSFQTLPDEMPVDTECLFNCQDGSNLIGSTKRTCLPIQQWDGLKTTCKPIRCIKIPRIPHGKVYPQECSREKQKHKARCNITCAEGFSGPGEIECISKGRHGSWSAKPRCVDVTAPKITCPNDIRTVAIFGENFGLVQWKEPEVLENSNSPVNIWWEPMLEEEQEVGPFKFEIGETMVTYYAVDQSGNGASCNFTVTVLDLEPPQFEGCTNPPPYLIGKEGIVVEWDDPNVLDNSGTEITVHRSKDFGPLPIGVTPVEYTAVDPSNNTNTCILNITVTQTTCENEFPNTGLENCNNVPNGLLCVLTCEEGYAFSMSDEASCENQFANWVIPECTPTEIPNEIFGEIEKNCLELRRTCFGDDCELIECEEDNMVQREPNLDQRNDWKYTQSFRTRRHLQGVDLKDQNLDWNFFIRNWHHVPNNGSRTIGQHADPKVEKYWNLGSNQGSRSKRQLENKKRRTKFRVKINKNVDLEQKFKGVIPETLKPLCKNGSIPLKSKKMKCVKCPRGFFHNITSKTCEPCPLNHYNDKVGATKCQACPPGTLTRGRKGSKGLKACKIHLGGKFRSLVRKETCKNSTCVHGKCIPVGNSRHRCSCDPDWVGVRCRIRKVDHCALEPCLNGGTCNVVPPNLLRNNSQGYTCTCANGFTGEFCELEEILDDPPLPKVNICKQVANLCENGGVCQPDKKLRGDYRCLCAPGFLGKRCQNVPCDYRPCPENNICVNVLENGKDTTRKSFKCICPEGKTDPPKCLLDLPIQDSCGGCRNNGTCLPNGKCLCPKGYLGLQCQEKSSGHYILEFPTSGMTDYALLKAPEYDLTEFTYCSWLQTNNTFNYGTILSYATSEMDNTLTLIDYSGLVLWINGKYAVTNIKINDGTWHHVCITWTSSNGMFSIFVDSTKKATGSGLSVGKSIKGGGIFVLGQDQDFPGGGFSSMESYVGKMAHLDIWNTTLDEMELKHKCDGYKGGNYVSWADFRTGINGKTKVLESDFCGGCKEPNSTISGGTWKVNENGSMVTLHCQKGYVIHLNGNPYPVSSVTRQCLASGRWQDEATPISCARVHCAPPPRVRHARITNRRRLWRYGDVVNYQCVGGTKSRGENWKTCGEGGRWTNQTFECIGDNCKAFQLPKEANFTIISEHVYDEDFYEMKSFDIGTTIEISCLNETYILTCLENQTWNQEVPKCQMVPLEKEITTENPKETKLVAPKNEVKGLPEKINGTPEATNSTRSNLIQSYTSGKAPEVPESITVLPGIKQVESIPDTTTRKIVPTFSTTRTTPKTTSRPLTSTSLVPKTTSRPYTSKVPKTTSIPTSVPKPISTSKKPIIPTVPQTTPKVVPTSTKPNTSKEKGYGQTPKEDSFSSLKLFEERLRKMKEKMDKTSGKDEPSLRKPSVVIEVPDKTEAGSLDKIPGSLGTTTSKTEPVTEEILIQKVVGTSGNDTKPLSAEKNIQEHLEGASVNSTGVTTRTLEMGKNGSHEVSMGFIPEIDPKNRLQEVGKNESNIDQSGSEVEKTLEIPINVSQVEVGSNSSDVGLQEVAKNGSLVDLNVSKAEKTLGIAENVSKIDLNDISSGIGVEEVVRNETKVDQAVTSSKEVLLETKTTTLDPNKIGIGCEGLYAPSVPDNGYLAEDNFDNLTLYEVGTVISFKCRSGYDLIGNNFTTCLIDGRWSDPEISCKPVKCPYPPKYSNMYPKRQIGMTNFHFGNMVNYECDLGFTFYGNNVIRCQANGRWSRMKGKCARISCGKPVLSSSEVIIGSSYLYKDSLHIMCPTGSARNHYEAKCTHSGKWLYIGNCHTAASQKNSDEKP